MSLDMHAGVGQGAVPDIELTKKGETYVAAALAEAQGVAFITITKHDPRSIGAAIDRLIDMLDDMEGDENVEDDGTLEPSLGWTGRGPGASYANPVAGEVDLEQDEADSEPSLGAPETQFNLGHYYSSTGPLAPSIQPLGSQASWASGASDEREYDGDDKEPDHDIEHSLGWVNEGSQSSLTESGWGEPDLGWPEQFDQIKRIKVAEGWFEQDGEPYLGWCENAGRGITAWEPADDREGDDERELDNSDGEPYLGALENLGSQIGWANSTVSGDLELDGSDREPSLGWTITGSFGTADDLEHCSGDYDGPGYIAGGQGL